MEPRIGTLDAGTTDQVADAGAGSVGDLIRACRSNGQTFTVTGEDVAHLGAGFHQDTFKVALAEDLLPPASAAVLSISNENEAKVTVDPSEISQFPVGKTVEFSDTGNAGLDAPQSDYYILANDGVTFTVNAMLADEPAPITQGTVTIVP